MLRGAWEQGRTLQPPPCLQPLTTGEDFRKQAVIARELYMLFIEIAKTDGVAPWYKTTVQQLRNVCTYIHTEITMPEFAAVIVIVQPA